MNTYESNIPYTLRFMIDTKVSSVILLDTRRLNAIQVVGMNWIEVPAGKYMLHKGNNKKSQCQIELPVKYVDEYDWKYFPSWTHV